jgi:hypothetical protein
MAWALNSGVYCFLGLLGVMSGFWCLLVQNSSAPHAAEQLFAEKGFEVVSVRDITQLAKANVAAVNLSRFIRYSPVGLRDGVEAPVKEIPQAIFDF